jgi:hypothetical protein
MLGSKMKSFADASWQQIEALREDVAGTGDAATLVEAGQRFVELFRGAFDSIVLARSFIVLPANALPATERAFAARLAGATPLTDATRVLCLLGSTGRSTNWNDRSASQAHLAIPLLSAAAVHEAPMIAKLLSDLGVDLQALDIGGSIATRQMLGGLNGTFFVQDARTALDAHGRHVIAAEGFAEAFGIRTVFGMGGAYVDGTIAVAIFFCSEELDRLVVDRFPSFISSFKMATAKILREGRVFTRAE